MIGDHEWQIWAHTLPEALELRLLARCASAGHTAKRQQLNQGAVPRAERPAVRLARHASESGQPVTDLLQHPSRRVRVLQIGGAILLLLLVAPFSFYAAGFGWRSLWRDVGAESYLFAGRSPLAENGLSLHMLAGAAVTLVVPLQILPSMRRRAPAFHRWTGRAIVVASLATAAGGLVFIAARGTIGGPVMDVGFALYGILIGLAAIQTIGQARYGAFDVHREWALRLAVLILGSWLFRVHYVLWYALTGGIGSNVTLTGPFDRVQVFAFYLPYLALLELYLKRTRRRAGAARQSG